MDKRLAKISKASLEIQERGILNFWIHVEYEEGCSQVVGGYALDEYCEEKGERIGTAYGCEMIRQLLIELRVNDFYGDISLGRDDGAAYLGDWQRRRFELSASRHSSFARG